MPGEYTRRDFIKQNSLIGLGMTLGGLPVLPAGDMAGPVKRGLPFPIPVADMAIAAMKKYPNIYAEITLTPVPLGMIEYLVEGISDDAWTVCLPITGWVRFRKLNE